MKFIEFPEISFPVEGIKEIPIPKMYRVRQKLASNYIKDISGHLQKKLDQCGSGLELKGKRIAVTVGSRGIPHNDKIVRTICDWLKGKGAFPFIVPAMGSHGGGCTEGNLEILSGYNITEATMRVPILAGMEVVQIGKMKDAAETPIFCDKYAAAADGIIIYNKVKPHTDFKGEHESGLLKMMAIGLGKHKGCSWFHKQGFDTFAQRIPMMAEQFLEKMPVIFGIGVVQNAYDNLSEIEVFSKEKIIQGDKKLLQIAREKLPRLPFDNIDVLIIDRIGKDISGEGADPNVTGRGFMPYFKDDFHTQKLFIRGLTEKSHHNACGLGLADITTRRCLNSVDWESTWINLSTNTMIDGGKIPVYQNSDLEALKLAIRTCTKIDYATAQVARIRNTQNLEEFEVSESILPKLLNNCNVEIVDNGHMLQFDSDGYMKDL